MWVAWSASLTYIVLVLDFPALVVSQHTNMLDRVVFGNSRRQLRAAIPAENLSKRAPVIDFHHNLELKYIEGSLSLLHYLCCAEFHT